MRSLGPRREGFGATKIAPVQQETVGRARFTLVFVQRLEGTVRDCSPEGLYKLRSPLVLRAGVKIGPVFAARTGSFVTRHKSRVTPGLL